ncbi:MULTISPECIES: hypothetical protein [Streptomyces]|uniref:hypothetical protein n=1 Tax=Streptomyces TaxID=1883 RepID=UPI00103A806C|nr:MULTISPECIES: hypothetical protein [Streptomyces]MBT3077605.1 hypothetical protein [Streptomyces sp. COG21]MBT3084451.1 hypothetical protein [Streptomyces sp. COG20]MBT3085358.1 hypothetical protein [Streptomyces sp. CYG21]MBT3095922.1 hypothetical protein [Streptomyces sp. CBG30]MBT3103599.1 hypothetical protein [Streptomyces sp. COG19]
MAVQNSTVEHPALSDLSPADVAAHAAGSYVSRPARVSQESPIPPSDPAARRRFVQQRQW